MLLPVGGGELCSLSGGRGGESSPTLLSRWTSPLDAHFGSPKAGGDSRATGISLWAHSLAQAGELLWETPGSRCWQLCLVYPLPYPLTPPPPVSVVPGKPLNPVPQLAPAFLAWLQLVPEQAGGRLGKGGPCFGWVYTESQELGIQAIQQAGKGCHGKGVWQPLPLSHGPCP